MANFCANCGKPTRPTDKFCLFCGNYVVLQVTPQHPIFSTLTAPVYGVQAPCAEGNHYACAFANCTCICHQRSRKPKSKAVPLIATLAIGVVIVGVIAIVNAPDLPSSTRPTSNSSPPSVSGADVKRINQTVTVGYWSYRVNGSRWADSIGSEFTREKPDAKFLVVDMIIRNNDNTASVLPPVKLVDAHGREFDESSKGILLDRSFGILKSLNPTVTSAGVVVFDVPPGKYWVKVSGGFGSTATEMIELEWPVAQAPS